MKTFFKIFLILIFSCSFCNMCLAETQIAQAFTLYSSPKSMPEEVFYNVQSTRVSTYDYLGKVVILNFFKASCKKCVEELPSLNELAKKEPSIVILTVSEGKEIPETLTRFFHEKGLKNLRVFYDKDETLFQKIGGIHVPETYLISPDGERIGEIRGPADFTAKTLLRQIQKIKP